VGVTARHEFWRDEVRALSLAMDSSSISDLARSLTDDGHPMLWHLLLFGGWHLTSSVLVLPAMSLLIAAAAVMLLTVRAPFPLWLKALFLFGLPAYEYSVMARNYGISMLLLFCFAALYPKRAKHPFALGAVLALLCNTNVHSIVFAGLLAAIWLWDALVTERLALRDSARLWLGLAIAAAGLAIALWTLWPSGEGLAARAVNPAKLSYALKSFAIDPAAYFQGLFPAVVLFPPVIPFSLAGLVLAASLVGLIGRPIVAATACVAIAALSGIFAVVYPGSYRHQALFLAFLVSLYWIAYAPGLASSAGLVRRRLAHLGLYGGLPALLAFAVATAAAKIEEDWLYPVTSSKDLARLLDARHSHAILVGEPDYLLEPLPYYADNPIYLVRERRFGRTVRFTANAALDLSLGELLCGAWQAQREAGRPVLIVIGGNIASRGLPWETGQVSPMADSYTRTFSWTPADVSLWQQHATLLARLGEQVSASDERYFVFSISEPGEGAWAACKAPRAISPRGTAILAGQERL
jgi:hypothetical protein